MPAGKFYFLHCSQPCSKHFDPLNHKLLTENLEAYGFETIARKYQQLSESKKKNIIFILTQRRRLL